MGRRHGEFGQTEAMMGAPCASSPRRFRAPQCHTRCHDVSHAIESMFAGKVRASAHDAGVAPLVVRSALMIDEMTGERLFNEEDIPLDVKATMKFVAVCAAALMCSHFTLLVSTNLLSLHHGASRVCMRVGVRAHEGLS